jgi:hypothetical protein
MLSCAANQAALWFFGTLVPLSIGILAGRIQVSVAIGVHADAFDPVPGTMRNSFLMEKSGPMLDQFKAGHGRVVSVSVGALEGEADAQSGRA